MRTFLVQQGLGRDSRHVPPQEQLAIESMLGVAYMPMYGVLLSRCFIHSFRVLLFMFRRSLVPRLLR